MDVETDTAEATDDDTVAVRINRGSANVDALEQIHATHLVVGGDGVCHFGSIGDVFDLGDEVFLLVPVLAPRVGIRLFANHQPLASFDDILTRERVLALGIPALRLGVEELVVEVTDLKQVRVSRRCCHEHIAVGAKPEDRFHIGQGLGEVRQLVVAVAPAVCLCDIFGRQVVVTEDETAKVFTVRQGRGDDFAVVGDFRATFRQKVSEVATSVHVVGRMQPMGPLDVSQTNEFCHGAKNPTWGRIELR